MRSLASPAPASSPSPSRSVRPRTLARGRGGRHARSLAARADAASDAAADDALGRWVTARGGDVSALRVGHGPRGRGLFAARDIAEGEAVLRVPIHAALSDDRACDAPYPGAPWSVVLASRLLAQRALGPDAEHAPYLASLPAETIGVANDPEVASADLDRVAALLADDDAAEELERYASLLVGAFGATTLGAALTNPSPSPSPTPSPGPAADASRVASPDADDGPGALDAWRWAMSQVHSRTFRVERPVRGGDGESSGARRSGTNTRTTRLLVPFADLLNHDSRERVRQCAWDCEWDEGGEDAGAGASSGSFVVRAVRAMKEGEEALVSYGERTDAHFCLFYGFLPEPNPHNQVALFPSLEDAAAWYEALCRESEGEGERGDERKDEREREARAWAEARARAVDATRREFDARSSKEGPSSSSARERERDPDPSGSSDAALRVGEDATVDERLIRLFSILSGDEDVAVAAARVRAKAALDEARARDAAAERAFPNPSRAVELARGYRARRRALLEAIA